MMKLEAGDVTPVGYHLVLPESDRIFFLSNKNGDLAGFFVLSRKDNICSSVCGPFSTKSRWQYFFINLMFFISFLFLVCTVSAQEAEQNGCHNNSHKSSGIKLLLTSSQRLREESVQEISTTNKTKKNRKNCSSSSERCAYKNIRQLKQLRRQPQQRLQKNNRFNDQNNGSACALRFLVHFLDVHCMTTAWNLLFCHFMEDVNIRRRIFLPLFEPE